MIWLKIADLFFLVFHTSLTLFNMFGWMWKRTRIYNMITLILTGGSWFLLGLFFGIGYCPFTDWHWSILNKLGKYELPESYIKYILDRITGLELNPDLVEWGTGVGFFIAFVMSIALNVRDYYLRRKYHADI